MREVVAEGEIQRQASLGWVRKDGELCGFRVALHVKLDDTWGIDASR